MDFKEIVQKRYATKKFDGKEIPEEKVNELFELIMLAPSSYGLQPWKIKVIKDTETKEKLFESSYSQAQIKSCSHLLVFCADKNIKSHINKYEEMMKTAGVPEKTFKPYIGMMRGFEENLDEEKKIAWAQRQTYLAIGNAVNGAKELGFDSCPMEGFLPEKYSELLNLPENLVPTALVTIGYAADTQNQKIRFKKEELFF